ncbi:MAG: hypothetical protein COU25_02525 [Candidatus Levybacteria bacterium CG10_big_fil_rev_8_21_14_0_10_35_13]|nr:MAG: hypothetical protein COU25_02525 [Candidatus Levybacteria bacterium CG10_big_fil_rev_8_21_14_0_10_35_13]
MKLNALPFLDKKENKDYFLSLILRNEKAKAVIFEKSGNTIKYINDAEEDFENTIEDATTEEFLNVLDKAITSAESALPQNIETHKTLLALKQSWIEDNKIKKEYLEKLKKAGEELSLDPIGFLVFSESIVNLIQKEEGAPVSAILAEFGKKYLTVTLVRNGKIREVRSSEIHESASFTVDTILKHLQTPEVLPSRIILLEEEEDGLTQEFIGHSWSKSLPFLHLPQIVSLPQEAEVKAVLLGASTQMGANLIFDIKKPAMYEKEKESEEFIDKKDLETDEKIIKENGLGEDEKKGNVEYIGKDSSMEFFGFSGGDVAKSKPSKEELKDEEKETEKFSEKEMEEHFEEIPEDVKLKEEQRRGPQVAGIMVLEKIKIFLSRLLVYLKKMDFGAILANLKGLGPKNLAILGSAGIVILLLLFYLFVFQTSAQITINQTPKIEEKSTTAVFSPNESTNVDGRIISAEIISIDKEGSVTTNATGKKDVGTKAKGTVTIFNNDTDSVTLSAGTVITASNGQKFTLDGAVSVASASGDIFSGTKPGTKNANVTAEEIGTEANVPSDTKFTVGTSKTIAGKNDNAFSGGSKKSVTVVSDNDIDKLRSDLPKSLEQKAKEQLRGQISGDKTAIENYINTDFSGESFDKKAGDEAKQVTLKATVTFDFVAYNKSDMHSLALKLFEGGNYNIDKNKLEVSAKDVEVEKDEDVSAKINIKAGLFAKINTNDLAKQIAGQSVTKVKNSLGNLENVSNVDIKVSPSLPFISGSLPKNPDKIKFTVSAN